MTIPDRQKQRQEYLRKKAGANSKLMIAIVLLICCAGLSFVCGMITLFSLSYNSFNAGIYGLIALASILALPFVMKWVNKASHELVIPYVPHVTPTTLPAEEILVRGSQEPTQQQSAVLLRAAESVNTPAEELLRASIDGNA